MGLGGRGTDLAVPFSADAEKVPADGSMVQAIRVIEPTVTDPSVPALARANIALPAGWTKGRRRSTSPGGGAAPDLPRKFPSCIPAMKLPWEFEGTGSKPMMMVPS